MPIDIDQAAALALLKSTLKQCRELPVEDCLISETIDFVFSKDVDTTYRYILFTALTAKAVEPKVDILSLQASASSDGSYDAEFLCSKAVYPFQKLFMSNVLGGSQRVLHDIAARYQNLARANDTVQGHSPDQALAMLCKELPKVDSAGCARICLAYLISKLIEMEQAEREFAIKVAEASELMDKRAARTLIDDLLDLGFNGAGIRIAAAAILRILFTREENYEVIPQPMRRPASSSRRANISVLRYHKPWLAIEVKDKPFTRGDIDGAIEIATGDQAQALLFVAAESNLLNGENSAYLASSRDKWMESGLYVGAMSIEALIDFAFATQYIDIQQLLNGLRVSAERMKASEPRKWLFNRASFLRRP